MKPEQFESVIYTGDYHNADTGRMTPPENGVIYANQEGRKILLGSDAKQGFGVRMQ
jgi:hypothetical protein